MEKLSLAGQPLMQVIPGSTSLNTIWPFLLILKIEERRDSHRYCGCGKRKYIQQEVYMAHSGFVKNCMQNVKDAKNIIKSTLSNLFYIKRNYSGKGIQVFTKIILFFLIEHLFCMRVTVEEST